MTELKQPQTSRAAQLWFKQDVFADMEDLDHIKTDDEVEDDEAEHMAEEFILLLLLLADGEEVR